MLGSAVMANVHPRVTGRVCVATFAGFLAYRVRAAKKKQACSCSGSSRRSAVEAPELVAGGVFLATATLYHLTTRSMSTSWRRAAVGSLPLTAALVARSRRHT
ncbi:MAG TPA: hypothetical protein VI248_03360 [Kineosporiaceae bacterium]